MVVQSASAAGSPSAAAITSSTDDVIQVDFTVAGFSTGQPAYVRVASTSHYFALNAEL